MQRYFWKRERKGIEEAAADLRGSKNDYEAVAQDTFREIKDEYLMLTLQAVAILAYCPFCRPDRTL
jgi:outer membrane protein TolC